MVKPDDVAPLSEDDKGRADKIEAALDEALRRGNGTTAMVLDPSAERVAAYMVRRYSDAGWVVTARTGWIDKNTNGVLISITHPLVTPDDGTVNFDMARKMGQISGTLPRFTASGDLVAAAPSAPSP